MRREERTCKEKEEWDRKEKERKEKKRKEKEREEKDCEDRRERRKHDKHYDGRHKDEDDYRRDERSDCKQDRDRFCWSCDRSSQYHRDYSGSESGCESEGWTKVSHRKGKHKSKSY